MKVKIWMQIIIIYSKMMKNVKKECKKNKENCKNSNRKNNKNNKNNNNKRIKDNKNKMIIKEEMINKKDTINVNNKDNSIMKIKSLNMCKNINRKVNKKLAKIILINIRMKVIKVIIEVEMGILELAMPVTEEDQEEVEEVIKEEEDTEMIIREKRLKEIIITHQVILWKVMISRINMIKGTTNKRLQGLSSIRNPLTIKI